MTRESTGSWAQRVFAITLVVEDLDAARDFYGSRLRPAARSGGPSVGHPHRKLP